MKNEPKPFFSEYWIANVFFRNFCKLFRYYLYSLVDWMLSGVVGLVWLLVALDPLTTRESFHPLTSYTPYSKPILIFIPQNWFPGKLYTREKFRYQRHFQGRSSETIIYFTEEPRAAQVPRLLILAYFMKYLLQRDWSSLPWLKIKSF